MEAQAALAKKYGVYGFCYYHYWFAKGKKLLEKPLELMLHNPKVDIPFCLCWANENWTRRWDGGNKDIIAAQEYDDLDNLDRHIDYLCEFFADPRYIRHDGKPFFVIYKTNLIPDLESRLKYLREKIKSKGFPGIFIAAQYPSSYFSQEQQPISGIDAYIQFEPLFIGAMSSKLREIEASQTLKGRIKSSLDTLGILKPLQKIKRTLRDVKASIIGKPIEPSIGDYDEFWEKILAFKNDDPRLIAGAFTGWDNTPRYKGGFVCQGTPQKFRAYIRDYVQKVRNEYPTPYLFINAWNEWGEGAYLEPDERWGCAYLEALRDALTLQ